MKSCYTRCTLGDEAKLYAGVVCCPRALAVYCYIYCYISHLWRGTQNGPQMEAAWAVECSAYLVISQKVAKIIRPTMSAEFPA